MTSITGEVLRMEYPFEKGSDKILSLTQHSDSQIKRMAFINMPISYDEVKSREDEILYMVSQLHCGFPYDHHRKVEV